MRPVPHFEYLRTGLQVLALGLVVPAVLYVVQRYYGVRGRSLVLTRTNIVTVGPLFLGLGLLLSTPAMLFSVNYVVCLG